MNLHSNYSQYTGQQEITTSLKATIRAQKFKGWLDQSVKSTQSFLRNDGHTGYIAKLENGESYLIHQADNGKIVATDSIDISSRWKPIGEPTDPKAGTTLLKMLNTGEKDNFLTKNYVKEYSPSTGVQVTSLAAAGAVGVILANLISGEYSKKSGLKIAGEITFTAGTTAAVVGISTKVPWIGYALAPVILVIQGGCTLSNSSISTGAKMESIGKNVIQSGSSLGIGIGFTLWGAAIGSAVPGIGTFVGSLIGTFFGGLFGTLSYIGIGKLWKIIKPEEILRVLHQHFKEGKWDEPKKVCEKIKMPYEIITKNCPERLKIDPNLSKELIFSSIVFFMILSIVASTDKNTVSETNKLMKQNYTFMNEKCQLSIKDYLMESKNVVESWTNIIK